MANRYDKQIVGDGWRGGEVRLTGVLDTSDLVMAPAISLSDFLNQDPKATFWGLRLDSVQFAAGPNLGVQLEWNASNPQLIVALTYGDDICFEPYGGLVPTRTNPGYDGAINLRTSGFTPGTIQNFTLMLSFVKLYTN